MPSPLKGLIDPAASPTMIHVGPTLGSIEPPIGSRPPVGTDVAVSGPMPQYSGAVSANSFMRCVVFTDLKSRNVDNKPMPTLISPSPTGKIHP